MPNLLRKLHPRTNPALGTFTLLLALNLLNYIDRYILAGEVQPIQHEFRTTDQQMGALGTAFFVFYMLAAPLTGWLGDRFRRKPLIITGAILWSLATLAAIWIHSYTTLYLRQALVGIGEATFGIFAPAVLSDFYPERDRNRVLSVFYIAIPVGAALGYLAGGQIGSHWGWRTPFFVCALPGFLVAALYGWIGREPERGASDHIRPNLNRNSVKGILTNPAFLAATLGLAALTFAMGGISWWRSAAFGRPIAPTWTCEQRHLMTSPDAFQLIVRLQAEYARCIDDDRLESWPDYFSDPCVYKITTAANQRDGLEAGIIFANSRGMLIDRVSALREANVYERQSYRHILGMPSILSQSQAGVRSETSFLVARIMRDGETEIFATGRYLDLYVLNGESAKLAERIVICDSSRIDTLLALPL